MAEKGFSAPRSPPRVLTLPAWVCSQSRDFVYPQPRLITESLPNSTRIHDPENALHLPCRLSEVAGVLSTKPSYPGLRPCASCLSGSGSPAFCPGEGWLWQNCYSRRVYFQLGLPYKGSRDKQALIVLEDNRQSTKLRNRSFSSFLNSSDGKYSIVFGFT